MRDNSWRLEGEGEGGGKGNQVTVNIFLLHSPPDDGRVRCFRNRQKRQQRKKIGNFIGIDGELEFIQPFRQRILRFY